MTVPSADENQFMEMIGTQSDHELLVLAAEALLASWEQDLIKINLIVSQNADEQDEFDSLIGSAI